MTLAGAVARGLGWQAGTQASRTIVRLVGLIVVARAIGPHEAGLAAMAVAFAMLGSAFADAGMGAALLQPRRLERGDVTAAFWLSAATGAGLAVAGIALAPLIAAFYGEPRVAGLFAVLAASFLVTALGTVPRALLHRDMNFMATELAAIAATVAAAGCAVALALAGAGAWAIVAQALVASTLTTLVVWVLARPRVMLARPSRAQTRQLARFGGDLLGSRLFFYLQRFADNVLVGVVLGPAALAAYALAYNAMMEPFARIVDPVRAVLHPAMASVRTQRERLTALWVRGTRGLVAVLLPLLITCAVVAEDLVLVVLGEPWLAAADPLRILAVVGAAQAFIALNSLVLTVLGETRALVRFSVLTFVASVCGFAAGLPFGIAGVAAGYAGANLVILPAYVRLTARALGVRASLLPAALGGVARAGALTALAVVVASALAADADPALRLAVVGASAAIAAIAGTRRAVPEVRRDAALLARAGVRA